MVDEFEVEPVFEYRQHERHQFKLVIDGRKYKGDYQDGKIQWLNPHPKQVVSESELRAVEAEVFELLGAHGVRDETERSEEHTSELQSRGHLVCRLLLEKKK